MAAGISKSENGAGIETNISSVMAAIMAGARNESLQRNNQRSEKWRKISNESENVAKK